MKGAGESLSDLNVLRGAEGPPTPISDFAGAGGAADCGVCPLDHS